MRKRVEFSATNVRIGAYVKRILANIEKINFPHILSVLM